MSIIIEAVEKKYGPSLVLNNINFKVETGGVVGLLGPNGAGKSTLLKILSCLIRASSGKVKILGFDVEKDSLAVRKNIGFLPETNPLYENMYVREYLEFSAQFYDLGAVKKKRINSMIEMTGLENHLKKKIGILSKGLKQRVGLAQVLLHDPSVLLLDEPTSGLDPNQIVEMRNLITSLGEKKTILFSSHIMQEVEGMCERIVILNEGRIVADGSTSEILNLKRGRQYIRVEFSGQIEEIKLKSIQKVVNVRKLKNQTWLIESEEGADIRKDLMTFAIDHGLTILSLNQQAGNLETVFRELTKKE